MRVCTLIATGVKIWTGCSYLIEAGADVTVNEFDANAWCLKLQGKQWDSRDYGSPD